MEVEIITKTVEHGLMELYLNSLLSNTGQALQDEIIVQQDFIITKAQVWKNDYCNSHVRSLQSYVGEKL